MKDSIIIYSSPTCPICRMIKMQLTTKGLEYKDVQDVEVLRSMNIRKIPTLVINGESFVGGQEALARVKEYK